MIRAVIDMNVLVSAMISPSGNEARLLLAINQKLVIPCFSLEILEEYADVLRRPKFGFEANEGAISGTVTSGARPVDFFQRH